MTVPEVRNLVKEALHPEWHENARQDTMAATRPVIVGEGDQKLLYIGEAWSDDLYGAPRMTVPKVVGIRDVLQPDSHNSMYFWVDEEDRVHIAELALPLPETAYLAFQNGECRIRGVGADAPLFRLATTKRGIAPPA